MKYIMDQAYLGSGIKCMETRKVMKDYPKFKNHLKDILHGTILVPACHENSPIWVCLKQLEFL